MNIKCLLIDDEPLALKVLENHISRIPWLEIAGSCLNPVDAFEQLKNKKIDLLFLDIQMPEMSGLEFLGTLAHPPAVIFTTAYRQFAAEAFDLDALDYLIKPISFPRFVRAVNKYAERYGAPAHAAVLSTSIESLERRHFFIRKGREMVKIYIDEVIYIESLKDYIQIFLKNGKYLYKAKISDMEEELSEDQFIRVHKSFLVNQKLIRSVTPTEVNLDSIHLPIGRSYQALVMQKLGLQKR